MTMKDLSAGLSEFSKYPGYYESRKRSLLKSISWRVFGSCMTGIAAYLLTGNLSLTLYIGAGEFFAKILLFYFHERLWRIIPYGIQ